MDEVHIDFFAQPTYVKRPYALSCTSLGPLPLRWSLSKPSDHFQAAYQVFHFIQVCNDMICTVWFLGHSMTDRPSHNTLHLRF